jgi:asparagine synthase (glutamine-hydrolysing)
MTRSASRRSRGSWTCRPYDESPESGCPRSMTAILALFSTDGRAADETIVMRMLSHMGARSGARADVWREGGVVLAVSRHEWEFGAGFSGPVLVVQDGDCVIAADASLYYRDDLRRKLAAKGVRPKGQTPSHLILAAYQAFGERCPEILEGDFSFILWDRKAQTVVAARDCMGRRPLFFAELGSTLIISSAIGAILEHPWCSRELNLPSIAESMAGYVSSSEETCYRSVSRLHAAHTLVREGRRRPRSTLHWEAPTFHSGSSVSFADAADQLRELLCDAVAERLSNTERSAVWMSGGRDSTAVFAAGMEAIRACSISSDLRPVSISYPVGDSGREDETIEAVAAYWGVPVQWLDIRDVPLLDMSTEHAARRDEPLVHVFERAYRDLAAATESINAHVALDGVGGDQLFLRSNIQLADRFCSGQWFALAREWKAAGFANRGLATFFRWAVQPALPMSVLLGARRFRHGRPLEAWLRRRFPEWLSPDFSRDHELPEFDRVLASRRRGEPVGSTESRWYFSDPFFPAMYGFGGECALEHGVELRSPLYDRRIIELAATRPISDHVAGEEGKRLLRRAMRDLLPSEVLAPRTRRTGLPHDYARSSLREALKSPFTLQFSSSALDNLGLIDVAAFERARTKFLRYANRKLTLPLLLTLHTELWLRAHGFNEAYLHEFNPTGRDAERAAASRLPVSDPLEDTAELFV